MTSFSDWHKSNRTRKVNCLFHCQWAACWYTFCKSVVPVYMMILCFHLWKVRTFTCFYMSYYDVCIVRCSLFHLHVSVSGVPSGHFHYCFDQPSKLDLNLCIENPCKRKREIFYFFHPFYICQMYKNYSKLIYSEKCFPMTLYWTLWTCPKLSEAKSQNIDYSHLWSMYDLPLGLGYKVLNCRSTHMGITSLRWVMAHSSP